MIDAERAPLSASVSWLALVGDAFGGRGGIAQYNRDFLSALVASGQASSVTVLPRLAPDRPLIPVGINQAPARAGRALYAITALFVAFRQHVDIVFCGHLYMAPLARLIARLKGAKLVVQTHGIEAWPTPSRLQRASVEAADLVLCVSRYTRRVVLGWAAIGPEHVLVVPNTVDERFKPGDASPLKSSLSLNAKRVLLTVARMDAGQRYKGHDRVIEAVPTLVASGHDVLYIVAGEGNDRVRLEDLATKVGVRERVLFLGAVASQTLNELYNSADVFVMPSTGEGFGIAFLEAMASGTPAIGLAVAGARDALADGELGTAVSADQLTAAIDCLLAAPRSNPDTLSARVRARFGRAAFCAQLTTALDRVVESV